MEPQPGPDRRPAIWDAPEDQDRSGYHEPIPSDDLVTSVETELGFRLPRSYIDLARSHNGGALRLTAHASPTPTSWAEDHVAVTGIFAIGRHAPYSLCGPYGQTLWLDEWGYPPIGVYFADTPSAGHDMIALDYRTCGSDGEPTVVHVDQEVGYTVTTLADTFEQFLAGLVTSEVYD